MKAILPLFFFVDACGWEIIKQDPFACEFAPNRKRLDSVFGYSSACVPSILSGRWPDEHIAIGATSCSDPKNSPFKSLRPIALAAGKNHEPPTNSSAAGSRNS